MSESCCAPVSGRTSARYRRILWTALVLNLAMFVVELAFGARASSVSLLADSLDFFGDAANYGISLAVLAAAVHHRARASQFKAISMLLFAAGVIAISAWNLWRGAQPEPLTMGAVGILALVVNVAVAGLLFAWREGDSNRRSVWLCSRNDALVNVAVVLAAVGVFGTGTIWPDLLVAMIIAGLAIASAVSILKQARGELTHASGHNAASPVQSSPVQR